jgi:hypothetical protein
MLFARATLQAFARQKAIQALTSSGSTNNDNLYRLIEKHFVPHAPLRLDGRSIAFSLERNDLGCFLNATLSGIA